MSAISPLSRVSRHLVNRPRPPPLRRVSDAGRLRDDAASSAAGVRKPPMEETALGDVGRCRVIELSRVKQPSDDQEDRLWGFNVWRHLYFQWLGRSKNTTPHNLNVSSSIFESMRQTDL